ncbi:MAG: aspartate aminotransferase, partial [Acidobacteria bacterium]|nr:aspartate aminotransferase [Acidobacteriota bacterium]
MGMSFSSRSDAIAPFLAMEVMERGMAMSRAGVDVLQLGVGEPGFPPPPEVAEAMAVAVAAGHTHYTDSRGLAELREAIARDCQKRRGVAVDSEQIIVTSGSSPALLIVLSLLLDPGDEVIIPAPYWVSYPDMTLLAEGEPVIVNCHAENDFKLQAADLENA